MFGLSLDGISMFQAKRTGIQAIAGEAVGAERTTGGQTLSANGCTWSRKTIFSGLQALDRLLLWVKGFQNSSRN